MGAPPVKLATPEQLAQMRALHEAERERRQRQPLMGAPPVKLATPEQLAQMRALHEAERERRQRQYSDDPCQRAAFWAEEVRNRREFMRFRIRYARTPSVTAEQRAAFFAWVRREELAGRLP